jgi:hypothetical protein
MLITKSDLELLRRNCDETGAAILADGDAPDHRPVIKLFNGTATWLITEIDDDLDRMFGLCDLGLGEPELGYVSLAEIKAVPGLERDRLFRAERTLSQYAALAHLKGRIVA